MPAATLGPNITIPLKLDAVTRRNGELYVRWDAPDATSATISFSANGDQFQRLVTTTERDVHFVAPSAHGMLRVSVTDGKHWTSADTRI